MRRHRARAADSLDRDVLVSLPARHGPGAGLLDMEGVAVSDEVGHLREGGGGGSQRGRCSLRVRRGSLAAPTHIDLDGAQHLAVPVDFLAILVGGDELDGQLEDFLAPFVVLVPLNRADDAELRGTGHEHQAVLDRHWGRGRRLEAARELHRHMAALRSLDEDAPDEQRQLALLPRLCACGPQLLLHLARRVAEQVDHPRAGRARPVHRTLSAAGRGAARPSPVGHVLPAPHPPCVGVVAGDLSLFSFFFFAYARFGVFAVPRFTTAVFAPLKLKHTSSQNVTSAHEHDGTRSALCSRTGC